MPSITIRDEQGDELLNLNLANKGLGKHLKSAASLRGLARSREILAKPLAEADGGRALDLALDSDVPVGEAANLTIRASARVGIDVHPSGANLMEGSDLQGAVAIPNGTAYASVTLEAVLKAGIAGTAGNIGWGFGAGSAVRYGYYHPFNTIGVSDSVKDAIATMLSSAIFPAATADLADLPVGAFVSLAGEGELSFSAETSLSTTANLLATPGLPLVGSVALARGATVSVAAAWTASGEFELRVSRIDDSRVRLEFYRRRGRSLSVSATGKAGVSLEAKGHDLVATLMKAISPDPQADLLALVDGGLHDEQIMAIDRAVGASIDRSLTLAGQLQVSALREDEALFAYEVALAGLDAAGGAAIDDALRGRLAPVGALAAAGGPVTALASAAARLRSRKVSWRVNLLGILNVASFRELVKEGSVTFDPASGALTAADSVTARRIRVTAKPLESDTEKLHQVLFESLMVTAAYQAGRTLGSTVSLTGQHLYVEQRGRTRRADLEDHYRALIALGLCDARERDGRLGGETEFGSSTFVIEHDFDSAACDALFFDVDGTPHETGHYETLGRLALLSLVPGDDPTRSFRRAPLAIDSLWQRVRELGGAIDAALRHLPPHQLAVARGDVVTVVWWASAMSRAARQLAEMRRFLGSRDAASLQGDSAFKKARAKLEDALGRVAATTEARFDDPWDVVAMDAAAGRRGSLDAAIISTRFAARYADTEPAPVAAPAERAVRSARARLTRAEAAGEAHAAMRDWTEEERDVLRRHVVNLGAGKLSAGGSFSSSREQVEQIFTRFIPEYAARQGPHDGVPRVLFFAHGGLVDEREGLLPVLARRRFWELNGIYPVYFVWETGIRETLRDIRDQLVPESRAARGPLTDLAIEKLARRGKGVWGQMKKNASNAAGPSGGSRLVAELAGRLWKALDGKVEFHALGHSAGAILHSHFLPLLVAQRPQGMPPVDLRSLHFLAPAITIALFKAQLRTLVGPGKPITRLTMYTMTDELEQRDESLKPYGKSLLYLVGRAFEDAVPTPLVGLQENLKRDLDMIRFFGLAGTEKVADVLFSRTPVSNSPASRSEATEHGGFDNDIPTMTSVVRRVLDVPDTSAVVDYFEDAVPGFERPAVGVAPGAKAAAVAAPTRTGGRAARPAQPAKKKWTVMVWMAGDNDLEDFGDKDLKEMKRVGSTDDIDVVVQFDSMRDDRTRRYHITEGRGNPDSDVVEELGETNTGDPAVAIDFFRWAIERYPAERLLGVIWNHGSGIDETDVYARAARGMPVGGARGAAGPVERPLVRTALSGRHRRAIFSTTIEQASSDRAIAFDDTSRDFLDNIELKKVLAEVKRETGRTLDLLGFDACLMNMVEVAYQVRDAAHVVVGSEELEPGDGWPYDRVLKALAGNPGQTSAEIGASIVDLYVASYRSGSITQSALNLSRVQTLRKAIDALATALTRAIRGATEYVAVTKALNATQRFDTPDYVDLGDLCRQVSTRSKDAGVKAAAKATIDALGARGGFVLAERRKGSGVSGATGVAIYFPRGSVSKTYGRLDFSKDSKWDDFLKAYHKA